MNNRKKISFVVMLFTMGVLFAVLTIILAFINLEMFVASLILTLLIVGFFAYNAISVRTLLRTLFVGKGEGLNAAQRSVLLSLKVPVLVTDGSNNVLWYNTYFSDAFLEKDIELESISDTLKDFDPLVCAEHTSVDLTFKNSKYTVYSSIATQSGSSIIVSYFTDDTKLKDLAREYKLTRPCVVLVSIDNYEEVMKGLRDSDKYSLLASVDRFMEDFINSTNGVLRKVSQALYFAVIEEQHITKIIAEKFKILDSVRSINASKIPITLSIGVGKDARTMYENQMYANQALDMALGRGGDQASVKSGKEFTFYGGTSREVEKRSIIKARTMAAAMTNSIKASSNVIIAGHKITDNDSVGSAVGLARMVTACGIPVNICVDEENTLSDSLIELMRANGYDDIFVSPSYAKSLVQSNTLMIVTDTQLESRVDGSELVPLAKNLIVIDHHRKMVNHITRAVLFYHDTFASSCSELVCELLQFMDSDDAKPTPHEALALLTGIMLDTKNFTMKTGVRTFEAAAYLRKLGAEPVDAKLLFSTSFEIYKSKADIVSQSFVYKGCAISMCDKLPADLRLAVPQAADDMLNIDGINASIVAFEEGENIHISARSFGSYNVQLIMENIGGGGHATMAGTQLANVTLEQARVMIKEAIDKYVRDEDVDLSMGGQL